MGLRSKLRQRFRSSTTTAPKAKAVVTGGIAPLLPGEQLYTNRTDIDYYKPNEIPRSKYRGKVDPIHQASLRAYTFDEAFGRSFLDNGNHGYGGGGRNARRRSRRISGTFSPGGTRTRSALNSLGNSRVASAVASRRGSVDLGADDGTDKTRSESADSADSAGSGSGSGSVSSSTMLSRLGLSDSTPGTSLSQPTTATTLDPSDHILFDDTSAPLSKHVTAHDTPFTAEELEHAMSRASLKPRDFDHDHTRDHDHDHHHHHHHLDRDPQMLDQEEDTRLRMASIARGRRTAVAAD